MCTAIEKADIDADEIRQLIDKWIFSERDRAILKRRLIDGIRFDALAEEFDLSVRHTKTIVYNGEKKVFDKINAWAF